MGDFQRCIDLMLAEEGGLVLGTSDISARIGAEIAPRPVLRSGFDQLDILFQQLVDKLANVDALALARAAR